MVRYLLLSDLTLIMACVVISKSLHSGVCSVLVLKSDRKPNSSPLLLPVSVLSGVAEV